MAVKSKLAIFDLDGTLFDTRRVNYLSYKKAIESLEKSFPIEEEAFGRICCGRNYKDFLVNDFRLTNEQADQVHELKTRLYHGLLKEGTRKNEILFDILKSISGQYYIAVVTTASKKNGKEILEYYGCAALFDLILTSEDVENLKPNPEGYIKAMRYFSVKPENTVVFEDMEDCVRSAKKLGVSVYRVIAF